MQLLEDLNSIFPPKSIVPAEHAEEYQKCAEDVVYWVNSYCWGFDPREENDDGGYTRFRLFEKQAEFLLWLKDLEARRKGGLVEKSRDSGLTFLCAEYALHGWLFRPGFTVGFGSRTLDLVDRLGDPDCIFEKIRMLMERLPGWMMPAGYSPKKHDNEAKILNPSNGASITGQGGDNIGRGGRKSIYFIDEAAFLERPEKVDRALSATTNVRIDVSTPNGQGNTFYRKRYGGKISIFTFHWKDDPRKSEEWAIEKRAEIGEVAWAQEYEIDYAASIEGVCIPAKWVRAAVDFKVEGLSATYPEVGGFDPADGGRSRSVLVGRRGPMVRKPISWGELSAGQAAWKAADEAERLGIETVNYDAIGVGTSVKEAWDNGERKLKFKTNGVKWGESPTDHVWPSGKTSAEMFVNLRAELWWTMRARFERTFQVVTEGAPFPPDELISIPNEPDLIAELSLPLCHVTNTGKIQLESKIDMAKRGVKSPDHGDALAYTFAPPPAGWAHDADLKSWFLNR